MVDLISPFNGMRIRIHEKSINSAFVAALKNKIGERLVELIELRKPNSDLEFVKHWIELVGPFKAGVIWFSDEPRDRSLPSDLRLSYETLPDTNPG